MHHNSSCPAHFATVEKKHTPLGLAGDDAKYSLAGAKVIVVCLNSILVDRQCHEAAAPVDGELKVNRRFLLFCLRHELSLGVGTLDPLYRAIIWSLNVAYSGRFPSKDWEGNALSGARALRAGSPIAGGPYCLTEVRGDWKWLKEIFDMKNFWRRKQGVCFKCKANAVYGPYSYVNVEDYTSVPRLSTSEFFSVALKDYISPICMAVGWQPTMVKYCLMHTLHLGLCHHLNGGAWLTLDENGWFGNVCGVDKKMEHLTHRFHMWCSLHGIHHGQPIITKGHLHVEDFAELRLKAYSSRIMTAFLAVVLKGLYQERTEAGEASPDLALVTTATAQLANWSLCLEQAPYKLSDREAQTLFDQGMEFLRTYKLLAVHHVQLRSRRYPLKPKVHAFVEILHEMLAFKESPLRSKPLLWRRRLHGTNEKTGEASPPSPS
ncbi:Uncharacterized protein SCF082_LOCUS32000 [Durusdinium trenchii]|uniref:Uncharacterized protein n=1 Tax=Durusdinium trenchii TaxID=1381693 RepID=A0ABP0NAU7_9DINO